VLLAEIDRFLNKTGMTPTAFGKAAIGDPNFVRDLRGGREPRSRLITRAQEFMRGYTGSPPTAPYASPEPEKVQP
jgi:hypothetical protein